MPKSKREIEQLLAEESDAIEADPNAPIGPGTQVTRGHGRTRTLQVRLNDDEFDALSRAAEKAQLPESTYARSLLLDAVAPRRQRPGSKRGAVTDLDTGRLVELVNEMADIVRPMKRGA
jgi:hypothetical protein